jgi:cell division protein ZapA (FtsZ GTPase activity inhibitor)
MDQITVSINIVGKVYKLKILSTEEERLRGSVKKINDLAADMRTNFSGLEAFDYLAMATMQFITSAVPTAPEADTTEVEAHLKNLISKLES